MPNTADPQCEIITARTQKQVDQHDKRINALEIASHVTISDMTRLSKALDAHLQANIVAHDKMYSTMAPLLESINKTGGATDLAKWVGGFIIIGIITFSTYIATSVNQNRAVLELIEYKVEQHNKLHKPKG